MNLKITFPPQVVDNLSNLLARPDGDLSVHMGSLGGSARICIEYSVALAGQVSATTVILMYAAGETDITKTQMYLLKDAAQLQSWFDSIDRETLLQTAVSLDFSTEAKGFVLNIESGEGVTTPATILNASRMSKYAIPAMLPHVDQPDDPEANDGRCIRFDGERYACMDLTQPESSMLLVDVENDPLNRKAFAEVLKAVARVTMSGPDLFEVPAKGEKPKAAEKTKTPVKSKVKAPSVDPSDAGLGAADVEGPSGVDAPMSPQPPQPPTPPVPEVAIATPVPDEPEAPGPQGAASSESLPNETEETGENPDAGEQNESGESGDIADNRPVEKSKRRSSAEIDSQAGKRLEARGFAVLERVDGMFDDMRAADAIEVFGHKSRVLSSYTDALRVAFLDRLAALTDSSDEQVELKAKFQAMIDQL